jgi:hypothetical protein
MATYFVYFVELAIVALCALYLVWVERLDGAPVKLEAKTRFLAVVGLCTALGLLFLGLASPYYGVVALLAVPAPVVFAVLIVRPGLLWNKPKLRVYLNLCVAASGLVWVFQILWQLVRWK